MKKDYAFKIILIVGLIIACITIYNDRQTIESLQNQLAESQHSLLGFEKQNQALRLQLDACNDKKIIHAENGVYTKEQMDEIDRRVKQTEIQ